MSMSKILRPYQQKAIYECWKSLKNDDNPVLLMASVGSGKSLMLANILFTLEKSGKHALCLVNNAELVRNNHAALIEEGGKASIFCAALGSKDSSAPVIFGTPQSILNGINKNEPISSIRFNLIVIDEAHNINYLNHRSVFMRILRHFKQEYAPMRVLGATGTDFRFKGAKIVGDGCLFKTQVGNITTEQLIDEGYLVKPTFEVHPDLVIDFSKVKIKQNGQFDQKQLADVIEKSTRLTQLICQQIMHIMESGGRFGCFLFATTRKHAEEILSHLPPSESAIILGDTPQHERERILNDARNGKIRYLVNISIISVGVDVPAYDTLAYLRPSESLVLIVQTMGRVLRLSPNTAKEGALVLDFAGNIDRHSHWDNPILLDALEQTIDKDKPKVIICPACQALNTETARRCIGKIDDKRCEYYFEWKDCKSCGVQNDIASRHCRGCEAELIDPNEKLSMVSIESDYIEFHVKEARYGITGTSKNFRVHAVYHSYTNQSIYEFYTLSSEKAKHVFYGQFVRKHCAKPSDWYLHLTVRSKMEEMLQQVNSPTRLLVKRDESGFKIRVKYFDVQDKQE